MTYFGQLPSIPLISWVSSKISGLTAKKVNPVRINVVSSCLEDTVGESGRSTQVEIFTIDNELRHARRQHESSTIVDAAFGDISSFLHNNQEEHSEVYLSDGPTNVNTRLAIITELQATPSVPMENEDQNAIEITTLPDIAEEGEVESARIQIREFLVKTGMCSENEYVKYKPSVCIHTHFDMMYVFGTSGYRTMIQTSSDGPASSLRRAIQGTQMVLFVIIVFLSILQSFCDAKYYLIWFLAGAGLNQLVRFAFHLTNLGSCAYGAYLLCRKRSIVNRMVDEMNTYELKWEGKSAKPTFSFVLATVTVVLASMKALLAVDFDQYSAEAVLLHGSYSLSEDLFLWSYANLNTTSLHLDIEFGTTLNLKTTLMGTAKILRDIAFTMSQGMMWDIIGNVVLVMLSWMLIFISFVHVVMENLPDDSSEQAKSLQKMRIFVWKMYREIRVVFAAVNDVFGPLLMLFHVTNVLRYAFFMERVLYPEDTSGFTYIHILYDIVKSEVIYLMATHIAQKNKVIRKWLRNWALRTGKINLGYTEMDITVVLDELDEEPLGLGQGDLIIHQGFHFGLLGLVSSLFVMLANKTGATV